jgi:hypothetical protein
MSQASLLAVARSKGYWGFRSCYEAALRRGETESGATTLGVSIRSDGRVGRVRVMKSELNEEASACLATEAEALSFKPAPGSLLGVELSVKLWPGDAPLPSLTVADPDQEPPGQASEALLNTASEGALPRLEGCYKSARQSDAKLWGRLQLLLTIDPEGKLEALQQRDTAFPSEALVHCAENALRQLSFPAPKGGRLKLNVAWRFGQPPVEKPNE